MDTSRSTLCSEPRSMLAKMFGLTSEDGLDPSRMENNTFFLDTDPNTFILNWLHYWSLNLGDTKPEEVISAADFYQLEYFKNALENKQSPLMM